MVISKTAKQKILDFVDGIFPTDSEVWLTGSRAIGTNKPDSDWDVLVIHEYCPSKPVEVFNRATQTSKFTIDGGPIQAVGAHPDILTSDDRRYFADCRESGIRLR